MLQRSISLLILLATCFAEFYPLHEVAVRDPRTFDLLYSSTSGPHNETWHFAAPVSLTAVIIPTQVFNFNSGGFKYPHYEQVFRDPASYDMLYSTTTGPINETWYFNRRVNLTGLILPSQIVSYCQAGNSSEGSWAKSPYAEDLEVRVYERNQSSPALGQLVAVGRYLGNATSGEELRVPLVAADARVTPYGSSRPPTMAAYNATSGSHSYIVSVAFSNSGLYPWYLRRDLATLSPLTEINNEQGLVIGLTFVLL